MSNCPPDIQPQWLSVIRRMQSVSKSEGLQVLTISVLVDKDGVPQAWVEPRATKIEPKNSASTILTLFAIDDKR